MNATTSNGRLPRLTKFLLPAVLLSGGIAFAAVYPLSRERHQEVRRELAVRRRA